MSAKLKLSLPLIVEGRYDKSTLSGFVDGVIITTGGFSIFNNKEKQALIRRIAADGIIVMTDSDGGGRQIRSFLSGIIPPNKIHHLFTPKIKGKESRKARGSASGNLGVEGMSRETLTRLLLPFAIKDDADFKFSDDKTENGFSIKEEKNKITKKDLYLDGLTGRDNSSDFRRRLCNLCELPDDMTSNALLCALNMLYSYEEYKKMIGKLI